MKIYDFAASPNARKVRALVYELGLKPEFVSVNIFKGEARTPPMLGKNPNGKIPTLEDGDFVLWESNAILTYLAAQHPEKRLLPTDPKGRASVDRWLFWQTAHFGPAVGKVAFERIVKSLSGRGTPDPAIIAAGTEEFKTCCAVLEASLGDKEYVAGRLSVADFALVGFFSVAEQCQLDVSDYPAVKAWLGRMLARDSVKQALADVRAAMGM